MRRWSPLFCVIACSPLWGCPGADKPEETAETAETGEAEIPETASEGPGLAVAVTLDDPGSSDATLSVLSSVTVSRQFASEALGVAATAIGECTPDIEVDGDTVDIDYSPCSEQGLGGTATCRDDQAVNLHEGFTINGLSVTGDTSLSLDGSTLHFETEDDAPIVVSDDKRSLTLALDLYGEHERTSRQTTLWGSASVTASDDTQSREVEVLIGGLSADTVTDDPLEFTLGDLCFCPSAGVLAVGTTYSVSQITVDPTELLPGCAELTDNDDDLVDLCGSLGEVTIELGEAVSAETQIATTFLETCGELEVEVSASELTVEVSWEELAAAACVQTCGGTWDEATLSCAADDRACSRASNTLGDVAQTEAPNPSLTLDPVLLSDLVLAEAETRITGEHCSPGSVISLPE